MAARPVVQVFGVLLAAGMLAVAGVAAADWPSGPVRLVVPFPPGGSTDMIARLIAEELGKSLGGQFLVENRPGGNTQIGNDAVAKARSDGQTLLFTTTPFSIIAALYPKLPYDAIRDFDPVIKVAHNGMILVAHPSASAQSVQDLIAEARAKPGSVLIASVGTTGISRMSAELFAAIGQIRVTHVPYKGTGQVMPDLLGGQVKYFFDNPSSSLPHVRAGKLRVLGFTGGRRSAALPGVPTMAEAGLPGYETVTWYGVLAPARTPAEILDRLHREIARIMSRPDVVERLARDAIDVEPGSRSEFAAIVRVDIDKWSKVIRDQGIKPE